ncbi:MAG: DUF1993 domain-containing protein [Burkholderiales bacterium]
MNISMYNSSVPVMIKMLGNLEAILDKAIAHAAARKIDDSAFVEARLFPDMFTFARQIRIATDMSKGAGARLAGIDIPKFEDNEKTLPELKARVRKAIDFLKTLTSSQIDGSEERAITITAGGKTLNFKGLDYLQSWALPNFYFHVATAYNLLRHGGVEIGKMDYLGKVQ